MQWASCSRQCPCFRAVQPCYRQKLWSQSSISRSRTELVLGGPTDHHDVDVSQAQQAGQEISSVKRNVFFLDTSIILCDC